MTAAEPAGHAVDRTTPAAAGPDLSRRPVPDGAS